MNRAIDLFRGDDNRAIATLRRYVDARQALDQMIETSRGELGRATPLTRELQGIRRRLNNVVRYQNRPLAAADDIYSEARGGQVLLERGRSLVAKAGSRSARELRELAAMTPEQRQMVRLGFLQRMADDVENKRLGNETVAQFQTPAGQRMIREVVGGQEAERLIDDIRREALTTRTFREIYSGSRTAPLLQDMQDVEEGAKLAASAISGNVGSVLSTLTQRLRRAVGRRQAREIMDMLSETEQVRLAQILDEIEAGGQALRLRQGTTGLLGVGGGAAAAGQGGQLAIQGQ
jgi:hypothetical protein